MKATKVFFIAATMLLSVGLCACEEENNTPGGGDNPGGGTTQQGGFDSNGASNATFSVSATEQIQFSRGNLQYKASTGTWRFAESQLDFVGNANSAISSNNSGWIDLFGWATSGWNNGNYWYKVTRGFNTAVTETHHSLETLIEENVDFTHDEERKINSMLALVNKLYE